MNDEKAGLSLDKLKEMGVLEKTKTPISPQEQSIKEYGNLPAAALESFYQLGGSGDLAQRIKLEGDWLDDPEMPWAEELVKKVLQGFLLTEQSHGDDSHKALRSPYTIFTKQVGFIRISSPSESEKGIKDKINITFNLLTSRDGSEVGTPVEHFILDVQIKKFPFDKVRSGDITDAFFPVPSQERISTFFIKSNRGVYEPLNSKDELKDVPLVKDENGLVSVMVARVVDRSVTDKPFYPPEQPQLS